VSRQPYCIKMLNIIIVSSISQHFNPFINSLSEINLKIQTPYNPAKGGTRVSRE